jgi:hypothetical protein
MRAWATWVGLLVLGGVAPAWAKDRPPRVKLSCKSAQGVSLPAKSQPRLTEPVTCELATDTVRVYLGTIVARGREKTGPEHSGDATQVSPLSVDLVPGTDFDNCAAFAIEARLQDTVGKVVWHKKLGIKQDCSARPVKARLRCVLEAGEITMTLPTRGDPRLEDGFRCSVTSADPAAAALRLTVVLTQGKREENRKETGMAAEGEGFAGRFSFAAGSDYEVCGKPMKLAFALQNAEGMPAFAKTITLKQYCPD